LIGGTIADLFGYNVVFYITAAMLFLAGITVHLGIHEKFTTAESGRGERVSFLEAARTLMSRTGVTMTFVIRFLSSLGRMMIFPIIPLFVATLMVDTNRLNTFTGLVLGIASAATTISSVFLGKLGDRIGYRKVLITSMAVMSGLYVLQGHVTAGWHLLVLQAGVGVALGGVIPIISALLANYIKAGGEGAVFGLDNSINAAGRTAAPMLGAAIATGMDYSAVFVATGLVFLISTLLAIWGLPPSRPATQST